jgi:hypothetical protein
MNMNFVLIIYKSKTHFTDLDPLPQTTVVLQTAAVPITAIEKCTVIDLYKLIKFYVY